MFADLSLEKRLSFVSALFSSFTRTFLYQCKPFLTVRRDILGEETTMSRIVFVFCKDSS